MAPENPAGAPEPTPEYPFQDLRQSFGERARDLVSRLDLEDKFLQMTYSSPPLPELGVPAYDWWNECLHGVARAGVATVFPQAIGLAAAFNVSLLHEVGVAIADEARAKHHAFVRAGDRGRNKGLTFWTPNVNIFRDPRWGRGQETYGEDPYLTARLGVTLVRALQGDDPTYLKLVATPKHFVVHSGPEAGRHEFNARVSPKDLRETYLPQFKACVVEGGAWSVMCAYNRTNDEVCCGSTTFLQEVLRDEWGFPGYVVSDCGAIADFHDHHHVTRSAAKSAALAVNNGCDLNCGITFWHLEEAVERGWVAEATIDRAVTRLFHARFKLGMFDPPERVAYQNIPEEVNDCEAHRALAREAARQSFVLLKNEGDLLPLSATTRGVAVVGPNADDPEVLLGNYSGTPSRSVTPLAGIRAHLTRQDGEGAHVYHARGSAILDPVEDGLAAARAAAERADVDVVVACLGINNDVEGEEGPGRGDRSDVTLPSPQRALLETMHATGKPVVLVLLNGGPVSTPWAAEHVPAILEAWYPGEEAGTALAEVLFGKVSPAGRLPVTIVRDARDLPPFEEYAMAGRTYRFMDVKPLFPFGYGLSYTTFQYSGLALSESRLPAGVSVEVRVTVENVGSRSGDEVVQVYLQDDEATTRVPHWTLVGFRRVTLAPGARAELAFTLTPRQMALITDAGECVLEPGTFTVHVGGQQPDARSAALTGQSVLSAQFDVTGRRRDIPY